MVGCHGHYVDFSGTFHAGPGRPAATWRELCKTAWEQGQPAIGILRPGMSFRGDADAAWDLPAKYPAHSFNRSAHGCGMTGEYPYLSHHGDCPDAGYHRVIEPGVTLCVESLIGADGGPEGVKLDRQLLITAMGVVVLSEFPFEAALLP